MSNHSLPARGTNPPFSHKSVVSSTLEQNIICSKTLICRQLFAGHVVSSRPMKRKKKLLCIYMLSMVCKVACLRCSATELNYFNVVHNNVKINWKFLPRCRYSVH